jgi:hypothetical protein
MEQPCEGPAVLLAAYYASAVPTRVVVDASRADWHASHDAFASDRGGASVAIWRRAWVVGHMDGVQASGARQTDPREK